MAITAAIETSSGLIVENGYIRVGDLQHSKLNGRLVLHFCAAFYASEAAANGNAPVAIDTPRQFINVPYDPDGGEPAPYRVAYAHLKTVWPAAIDA